MSKIIKLKLSTVQGKLPTLSDLQLGELAINSKDGKVYLKKSDAGVDSIVEVGSGSGLEVVTENSKSGHRFVGRDPNDYGDIGQGAVDLSMSTIPGSLVEGATGDNSFAVGLNTRAVEPGSSAFGRYNNPKTDSIFEVGIGLSVTQRYNAFEIYNTGAIIAPELQPSLIIDNKSLVTKEYVDGSVGGNFIGKDTTGTLDTIDKIWTGSQADYDNLGTYLDTTLYFIQ